jgi:putative tryptophan/tyrosine transport system substrate-binding protein
MTWKPTVPAVRLRAWIASWMLLLLLWCLQGAAAAEQIAIMYPPASPPAKAVYDEIRRGIEQGLRSRGISSTELVVERGRPSARELVQWSKSNDVRVAIALGRSALEQSELLRRELPVIAGATNLSASADVAGVNLTANPRLLLSRVRELAPGISRILVVTQGEEDAALLRAAQGVARSLGLEIVDYPAKDLREATQHYWSFFRYSNPKTDAVWLLGDASVDAQSTLPSILEAAWAQRFIVLSNVVEHVRRGALLATFVDGDRLGARLASLAADAAAGRKVGQSWGEDVDYAVNARVALHLGLELNERTKARYGLVVGER